MRLFPELENTSTVLEEVEEVVLSLHFSVHVPVRSDFVMFAESSVVVLSVVVLSVVVLSVLFEQLSQLLLQEMMVRLKRMMERMMRVCFTWFPISGLGEPNIYQNLVWITICGDFDLVVFMVSVCFFKF